MLSGTPDPGAPGEDELPPLEEDVDLGEDLEGEEPPQEDELEAEPEPEPPPRQTRRERQQDNWRERALRAEAERDVYRGQATQPRQPAMPDPAAQQQRQNAEYERIANLPFEQQAQAYHEMMRREVAVARVEAFDLNDRARFETLQDRSPAAKRLADKVEQVLQAQRANGIYSFSREQVYHYLLGQEVDSRSRTQGEKQRRQGAANVARQTVRPGGQRRGDVAQGGNRVRGEDADMRLLMGTKITDL